MTQGSLNHSKILFLKEIIKQTLLFFNNTKIITTGKIYFLVNMHAVTPGIYSNMDSIEI
jgi:hypothetical protein